MKSATEIVTFSVLIKTIMTVLGICGSILAFIYFQHVETQHDGSLSKAAFVQFETRVMERFNEQNSSILRLENASLKMSDKLDDLSRQLKR